ncbi:MAG: hypothetical protein J5I57_07825 [Melioribacteraceae bacterium]|nr:hypothetical protein [Melioribacteraceae bacterium]
MNFLNSVPGQEKALNILNEIFNSKRIPNALLFTGKQGVGKFLAAINFLKLINSSSSESIRNNISQLKEPYVKYIFPLPRGKNETGEDGPFDKLSDEQMTDVRRELELKKSNPYYPLNIDKAENIKITSIRDVKRFLSMNFDDVKHRAIIIDDAHLMSNEAQNALLKSLEEPPHNLFFILITPYEDRLLTTTKSRCWTVNFIPLSDELVENILVENLNLSKSQAAQIAPFAEGSIAEALSLAEMDIDEILENVIKILRYSLARKYSTAMSIVDDILKRYGEDYLRSTLRLAIIWFSDVVKNKYGKENYYFNKFSETIIKFNKRFADVNIFEFSAEIDRLITLMDKKVSLNLIVLNTIFGLGALGLRNQ